MVNRSSYACTVGFNVHEDYWFVLFLFISFMFLLGFRSVLFCFVCNALCDFSFRALLAS